MPSVLGLRAALGATLTLGLVLPASSVAAYASAPASAPAQSPTPATGTTATSDTADYYRARAMVKAKATGRATDVSELTTEISRVVANPNGTFTQESNARPVRAKVNGAWKQIDNTLVRAGSTLTPKVTSLPMMFSSGGDGPLATIGDAHRQMSLTWAGISLPKPVVEGDTATYSEVLPGVDLVARADADGYSHVLVVKDRKAARNPALRSLSFDLSGHGLNFRTGKAGDVQAVDAQGRTAFLSPSADMWDSSTVDAHGDRRGNPGPDAKVRRMGMKLTGKRLGIVPDQSLLSDPATRFPVYIDPPWGGTRLAWAYVDKNYPTTAYYNKSTSEAFAGYESQSGGTKRSFFRMDTSGIKGKNVLSATFKLVETWAWSCNARPVQAWATNSFGTATTWNSQPSWTSLSQERNVAYGWHPSGQASPCPGDGGGIEFDVKAQAIKAAAGSWSNMTVGVKAGNESDTYGWKRFKNNPTLSTTYDSTPSVPTGMTTSPSTPCTGGAVGNTDVTLTATPKDPDGGTVQAEFNYWKSGGAVSIVKVSRTSGVAAQTTLTKASLSDGTWNWKVRTLAGTRASGFTATCSFRVDKTAPTVNVGVTSTVYPQTPADATDPVMSTTPAGTPGAFTIDAKGNTDVTGFLVGINDPNPSYYVAANAPGGKATVSLTPTREMSSRVYVKTQDAAGNVSLSTDNSYEFYAPAPTAPEFADSHDLNTDGNADILAIGTNGDVCAYLGSGAITNAFKAGGWCSVPVDYGRTAAMFKPVITDWNHDGFNDVITLVDADNNGVGEKLQWFTGTGMGGYLTGGWMVTDDYDEELAGLTFNRISGVNDFDGDGSVDIVATDAAGVLWVLRSDGYGRVVRNADSTIATKIGSSGWNAFFMFGADGDVNQDGLGDVYGRDSAGVLYLYGGNGSIITSKTQTGTGWNMHNHIFSVGDWNNDGVVDVGARAASDNSLYFYTGKGTSTAPFINGGIKVGSGWGSFRWIS